MRGRGNLEGYKGEPNLRNINFFCFDICYSPIFLLSKTGLYSNNTTFDFMVIYLKRVSSNIGENAICGKMFNFHIKCDGSINPQIG